MCLHAHAPGACTRARSTPTAGSQRGRVRVAFLSLSHSLCSLMCMCSASANRSWCAPQRGGEVSSQWELEWIGRADRASTHPAQHRTSQLRHLTTRSSRRCCRVYVACALVGQPLSASQLTRLRSCEQSLFLCDGGAASVACGCAHVHVRDDELEQPEAVNSNCQQQRQQPVHADAGPAGCTGPRDDWQRLPDVHTSSRG
jgi:hypothetical protein